jgi:hypothetical protein
LNGDWFLHESRLKRSPVFFGLQAKRSGQVSVEYLVLTILLLGFVIILGGIAFIVFSDSFSSNQVLDSLRILQTAVNHVNALGPGNSVVVSISLPQIVVDSNVGGVSGKELVFVVSTIGGDQPVWIETDANVLGSLPKTQGTFPLRISADVNGVLIQDVNG